MKELLTMLATIASRKPAVKLVQPQDEVPGGAVVVAVIEDGVLKSLYSLMCTLGDEFKRAAKEMRKTTLLHMRDAISAAADDKEIDPDRAADELYAKYGNLPFLERKHGIVKNLFWLGVEQTFSAETAKKVAKLGGCVTVVKDWKVAVTNPDPHIHVIDLGLAPAATIMDLMRAASPVE